MAISARNDWPATVEGLERGPVSTEVRLRLETGDAAVATITTGSADRLGLAPGTPVRGLVKASSVVLLIGDGSDAGTSARNCLAGQVTGVEHGTVHSIVGLRTAAGTQITASITRNSAKRLGLATGQPATALVKASDVMLMTEE